MSKRDRRSLLQEEDERAHDEMLRERLRAAAQRVETLRRRQNVETARARELQALIENWDEMKLAPANLLRFEFPSTLCTLLPLVFCDNCYQIAALA